MANRLEMLKSRGIKALGEAVWSGREIARGLGVSGRTNPGLPGARAGEQDHSAHRGCARAGARKCVAWVIWVDWHAGTFCIGCHLFSSSWVSMRADRFH